MVIMHQQDYHFGMEKTPCKLRPTKESLPQGVDLVLDVDFSIPKVDGIRELKGKHSIAHPIVSMPSEEYQKKLLELTKTLHSIKAGAELETPWPQDVRLCLVVVALNCLNERVKIQI
jgi:hypothetical protein